MCMHIEVNNYQVTGSAHTTLNVKKSKTPETKNKNDKDAKKFTTAIVLLMFAILLIVVFVLVLFGIHNHPDTFPNLFRNALESIFSIAKAFW